MAKVERLKATMTDESSVSQQLVGIPDKCDAFLPIQSYEDLMSFEGNIDGFECDDLVSMGWLYYLKKYIQIPLAQFIIYISGTR